MSDAASMLQTLLDKVEQAKADAYKRDLPESEEFQDVNCTYQMLTLLSCYTENSQGKIYNGHVSESTQNTPALVATYFLSPDASYSFGRFLSFRPDLAVNVMDIFSFWLPEANRLTYALLDIHNRIKTATNNWCSLSSYEREFIEVGLKNDLALIIDHYGYDPRDPKSYDEDEEEEEEDGVTSKRCPWGLEMILEEEE
jgi:hypothetical protein